MSKTKLIDLAAELADARGKLEDLDLDNKTIDDTIEGLALPFERKAVAIYALHEELLAKAEVKKQHAKRVLARAKAEEERAERLLNYIGMAMRKAQIKVIESPETKFQIVNGKAKVVIDAASQIPIDYMRFPEPPPPAPDKDAIWRALSDGNEVPGCHLEPTDYLKVT